MHIHKDKISLFSLQYWTAPDKIHIFLDIHPRTDEGFSCECVFYNEQLFERGYVSCTFNDSIAMSLADEVVFEKLCRSANKYIDCNDYANFQMDLFQIIPEWMYFSDIPSEIGEELLALYYSFHAGPKEILYKACLWEIAKELDHMIKDYDPNGSDPEKIIGLPLRLLRILNHPMLVNRMKTQRTRQFANCIYGRYNSYFSDGLPGVYQWKYLEDLGKGCFSFNCSESDKMFDRRLYNFMGKIDYPVIYEQYKKYASLAASLGDFCPIALEWPAPEYLALSMLKMKRVKNEFKNFPHYQKEIEKKNCRSRRLEYENAGYRFFLPDAFELVKAAKHMHNCLSDYLSLIAMGIVSIILVSKKENPLTPIIAMEIEGNELKTALCAFNKLPNKQGEALISEYICFKKLQDVRQKSLFTV